MSDTMRYCIDALRSQIPISLESGKQNLTAAANTISSISIPSDFQESGLLRNIEKNLVEIIAGINTSKQWVINKAQAFQNLDAEIEKINELFKTYSDIDYEDGVKALLEDPEFDKFEDALKMLLETTNPQIGKNSERYTEAPLYIQQDYPTVSLGGNGWTLSSHGCGYCANASVLTYLTDSEVTPVELAEKYGRYNSSGKGAAYSFFDDTAKDYGVNVHRSMEWADAKAALENGQVVITVMNGTSIFTDGGHYIALTGMTEDGKILVNDSNRYNHYDGEKVKWVDSRLTDGFENGFDEKYIKQGHGFFWIYDKKEEIKSGSLKSQEEIYDDIINAVTSELYENSRNETLNAITDEASNETLDALKDYYGNNNGKLADIGLEGITISDELNLKNKLDIKATNLSQKNTVTEKYPEIPTYNQKDYPEKKYNGVSIANSGCGVTAYAAVLTYLRDEEVTPEEIANKYHGKYFWNGTSPKIFLETAEEEGVSVKYCTSVGWREGEIMEALENGQPIIALVHDESIFTDSAHYIILDGLNEDGRIIVKDPNGNNYKRGGQLKDGFENGFPVEMFRKLNRAAYYIFNEKDTTGLVVGKEEEKDFTVVTLENDEKPDASKLEAEDTQGKPETEDTQGKPESSKPEAEDTQGKPESSKPEAEDTQGKPESSKPETEDTQGKPEDSKPDVENTQGKPDTTKPNTENVTRPTVKPSEPEYVEPVIQEKTPEAIIDAAQKAPNTTSSSEYVCSVLHESGYLSAEGKEILKNYSIDDLCAQFEKFGWEKITQSNNIQVGDIVIMKTGDGTVAKIYAGYDLWYVQGNTELQIVDPNWDENTMWYAYRPSAYPMGPTITL